MKKKLLSVLMAGVLVATSSVNAFADVITGADNKEHEAQINIKGDIQNSNGDVLPGTITVTVPTAASFTLDKDGIFHGTTITVENKGTGKVDIYAKSFTDVTPTAGITVVGTDEATERGMVSLHLRGTTGTAYFSSTPGDDNNGIYTDPAASEQDNAPIKLADINPGSSANLELEGSGVLGNDPEAKKVAMSDNFTLVLKIAKSK